MNEELERLTRALNNAYLNSGPVDKVDPLQCSLVLEARLSDESDITIPIPHDRETRHALHALLLPMVEEEIRVSKERVRLAGVAVNRTNQEKER